MRGRIGPLAQSQSGRILVLFSVVGTRVNGFYLLRYFGEWGKSPLVRQIVPRTLVGISLLTTLVFPIFYSVAGIGDL